MDGNGYNENGNIIYQLIQGKGSIKDFWYIGEYLNEKKSGKGLEYDFFDKKKFKGNFLKNKRLKGKLYYNQGKLLFEGEFKHGKKWNGNIYDINGNIIVKLINGSGNGKEYNYDGELEFEGEYLNGK